MQYTLCRVDFLLKILTHLSKLLQVVLGGFIAFSLNLFFGAAKSSNSLLLVGEPTKPLFDTQRHAEFHFTVFLHSVGALLIILIQTCNLRHEVSFSIP